MTWWRIGGSSGLAASADNACPHPSHCVGMYVTIAVGSRAVRKCPGCPGWPPGLRPVGDEGGRRCHGGSDEGGLDELEELRFNCSFKALSSSLSSSSSARNLTQSWQGGLGADSSMPYSIGTRSSKIEWSERLPRPPSFYCSKSSLNSALLKLEFQLAPAGATGRSQCPVLAHSV